MVLMAMTVAAPLFGARRGQGSRRHRSVRRDPMAGALIPVIAVRPPTALVRQRAPRAAHARSPQALCSRPTAPSPST